MAHAATPIVQDPMIITTVSPLYWQDNCKMMHCLPYCYRNDIREGCPASGGLLAGEQNINSRPMNNYTSKIIKIITWRYRTWWWLIKTRPCFSPRFTSRCDCQLKKEGDSTGNGIFLQLVSTYLSGQVWHLLPECTWIIEQLPANQSERESTMSEQILNFHSAIIA